MNTSTRLKKVSKHRRKLTKTPTQDGLDNEIDLDLTEPENVTPDRYFTVCVL